MIKKATPSNEELVRRYQEGDQSALTELIEANKGGAYQVALKYVKREDGIFDDAVQSAFLGMVRSVNSFDCDRGVKFVTYAWWSMTRSVWTLLRTEKKARLRTEYFGDEWQVFGHCYADSESPHDETVRADECTRVHEAIELLDERKRDIIRRRLSGQTLESIGQDIGVCKERVRQIENVAKEKISEYIRNGEIATSSRTNGRELSPCCGETLHRKGFRDDGSPNYRCGKCDKRHVPESIEAA